MWGPRIAPPRSASRKGEGRYDRGKQNYTNAGFWKNASNFGHNNSITTVDVQRTGVAKFGAPGQHAPGHKSSLDTTFMPIDALPSVA